MSDHTHSVAEMIVDGSWGSGNLGVKPLLQARSFHAALLDRLKFHSRFLS